MAVACVEPLPLYRPRDPQASDPWRLLDQHFETFQQVYDERFAARYGFSARHAGDFLGGPVERRDPPLVVHREHAVGDAFEYGLGGLGRHVGGTVLAYHSRLLPSARDHHMIAIPENRVLSQVEPDRPPCRTSATTRRTPSVHDAKPAAPEEKSAQAVPRQSDAETTATHHGNRLVRGEVAAHR